MIYIIIAKFNLLILFELDIYNIIELLKIMGESHSQQLRTKQWDVYTQMDIRTMKLNIQNIIWDKNKIIKEFSTYLSQLKWSKMNWDSYAEFIGNDNYVCNSHWEF